jgi:hypothetical protein
MTPRLWCALLAGHVAWSLHLMVSYYLAALACAAEAGDTAELAALRHAATIAAAAVTLASAAVAWPDWRQAWSRRAVQEAGPLSPGSATPPRRFLARVTFPLNIVSLFAILAAGTPNLFLAPCA